MKKLTAVIPTLLKKINVLNNLIETLVSDSTVEEIIVINNSTDNFSYENPKVRIISKGENLFVNPSWNLGVAEAKCEYIALVNDDIIIPQNFCSAVLNKMNNKHGIVGIDNKYITEFNEDNLQEALDNNTLDESKISLTPVKYRTKCFGVMMFFNKNIYKPVPEDLKIFFGDDYIVHYAKKAKKQNAVVSGQNIYHYGSMSSKGFNKFAHDENKAYKKYIYPWYKRIFYFYERDTHYAFYFLFLNFSIRKK